MELSELVKESIAQIELLAKKDKKKQISDEKEFLNSLKERFDLLLVALESEAIVNLEDKLELTIDFLKESSKVISKRLEKLV